jgi:hypothetical protein
MNSKAATMEPTPKRWYREPWPWILMAGPFIVIVAGFVTAWIAVKSSDPLVTDDYYKKGLAVSQTLAQSKLAEELGIEARLRLSDNRVEVGIASAAEDATRFPAPAQLRLTLSHPTRAGLDQTVELNAIGGQRYAGDLRLPASGHWIVMVEDGAQTWRLLGNVVLPAQGETLIGGGLGASASKGG